VIIACGEALIDMLPRKLADGSDVFLPAPGGALFNTALALGRLGMDAGFLSGLSTDRFGRQLIAHLQDSGVNTDFCVLTAKPTTLAFVDLIDGHAHYTFMDENSANRALSADALPSLPDDLDALHFGAISLIPRSCGSAYEALQQRNQAKAVMSLDPNIRPAFIEDEQDYRGRIERMIGRSDIIKISEDDLAWLAPGADIETVVAAWLAKGAAIVILTRGEAGSRLFTGRFEIAEPAPRVEVVDTVGAGDTFNAGFLARLKEKGHLGKSGLKMLGRDVLQDALKFASSVAAYTVSRAGCDPPTRADLA
jgi:fructokinase